MRRDELATLAEIGALNAFGHDRRSALWQIERAVRPSGPLMKDSDAAEAHTPRVRTSPPSERPSVPGRVTAQPIEVAHRSGR